MAGDPNKPTDYRARPLPENQGLSDQLTTLQPEQRVVVEAEAWYKSKTVIINGLLLVGSTLLTIGDLIFGANLLEPLVGVFLKDPEEATKAIMVITQIYSLLGLYLRAKTTSPITLRRDVKE